MAHSQGGLAATHLHAYYWSNLETAKGGRLIQSVGSPYYGSGLAGNLAAIGTRLQPCPCLALGFA